MRITAQEEYGLRCILQIARHAGDSPTAISEIAKAEGLSTQYVAKLLNRLQRAHLLLSVRGIHGGFRLMKPAATISVGQVLEALGGTLQSRHKNKSICETFVGNQKQCVHMGNCGIRPLWTVIMRQVTEVLNELTLQHLLDEETASAATIEGEFHKRSQPKPTGIPLPAYAGGTTR